MLFAHPGLLILALLAPLAVAALALHAARARRATLARLGTAGVVEAQVRGGDTPVLRALLVGTAAALLGIALAGPRLPGETRQVAAKGLDLVIALDVSQSMLAEDVAPSRLARARAELKRLIADLPTDRIGLVLFAGDAFIQSPLTTDHSALRLFLDAAAPEMMPTQGTDFDAAIGAALDTFGPPPSTEPGAPPPAARVLLIVSDGERHAGETGALTKALREARVLVLTAGVGEATGATIPVYDTGGAGRAATGKSVGEKIDPDTGEPVLTRLDPTALRALAGPDGYFHLGASGGGFAGLPDRLKNLARAPLSIEDSTTFRELFAYPLGLALLLLLLEPLLGGVSGRLRRRRTLPRPSLVEKSSPRPARAPLPAPHA